MTRPGANGPDPREALRLLMEGNQRWIDGKLEHPHQSVQRRHEVAAHQDPLALVFSCIDSRVPPEIIFDRGVGDLFVFRTGAEAMDNQVVLGSVEFGPNGYASSRLIFVLGHERCGAVIAAIDAIQTGQPAPGHIQAVVDALRPAYETAFPAAACVLSRLLIYRLLLGWLMTAASRTYWLTEPCRIRRENDSVRIERADSSPVHVPVTDIRDLVVFDHVDVNTSAISLLSRHGISVHVLDHYGNYAGAVTPAEDMSSAEVLRRQVTLTADPGVRLAVARGFVAATAVLPSQDG